MTSSSNGARQPVRHDLSAKPGEGFGAWSERVRRVAVIDPELVGQEKRRMAAEDQRRREAAEQSRRRAITGLRWVLGCMAALAVSALLYAAAGLTGWIVVVCALATAISLPAYVLATRPGRSAIARPGPVPGLDQAVLLTELDEPSRELLAREQRAIDEVISSEIYQGHEPARWAVEAQLRRIEWQSAARLYTITLRQAQYDAIPVLGGLTADVLGRQQPHLTAAEDATVAEVQAIEALAARARRAELERRDLENAIKVSRLDGSYQELGASVAAADLAIEEIRGLADTIAVSDEAEPA